MVNSSEFVDIGIDDGKVSEKKEWPSEKAQKKAQDSQKKAKQVQAQIQQDSKQNRLISEMLKYILDNVNSDSLLNVILELITNKSIEIKDVFIILLPFIKDNVSWEVWELVQDYSLISVENKQDYYNYVRMYSLNSFESLNQDDFVDFIIEILLEFNRIKIKPETKANENEEYAKIRKTLVWEIYN